MVVGHPKILAFLFVFYLFSVFVYYEDILVFLLLLGFLGAYLRILCYQLQDYSIIFQVSVYLYSLFAGGFQFVTLGITLVNPRTSVLRHFFPLSGFYSHRVFS